jgi:malate-CoA ligase subunit beta
MATMDMIRLKGGAPANFLDIGGGASPERVLRHSARCWPTPRSGDPGQHLRRHQPLRLDRRRAWCRPTRRSEIEIPVVVRLSGTNVEAGQARSSPRAGLPIITADTLAEAAEMAVAARSQKRLPERSPGLRRHAMAF